MVILTSADATTLVAEVVSYLTDNWAALLVVVAFGVGLSLFRGIFNRSTRGRI